MSLVPVAGQDVILGTQASDEDNLYISYICPLGEAIFNLEQPTAANVVPSNKVVWKATLEVHNNCQLYKYNKLTMIDF